MTKSAGGPGSGTVLALDIGRSHARVTDRDRRATAELDSGVSLSDADAAATVAGLVGSAVADWATTAGLATPTVAGLAIASTGAVTSHAATQELTDRLAATWPTATILITGDVVAAHAGVLGGAPGVVAVAGTGAVALGVGHDGSAFRVDGQGPWLGDDGSGFAVGRAGLRAALRAHDGRPGGSDRLAAAVRNDFGALADLPTTIQSSPTTARDIASFAPAVAAAARAGDPVAAGIWDQTVTALATTISTAIDAVAVPTVGLLGSLFDLHDLVTDRVLAVVTHDHPDLAVTPAAGDALDGVLALLATPDGVHEPLVTRVEPATPTGTDVAVATSPHARGGAP